MPARCRGYGRAVAPRTPGPDERWRCSLCGNLTRFDVVRVAKVREYVHVDLSGEPTVEESEVLAETVEMLACRWCGAEDRVEVVARPSAGGPSADVTLTGDSNVQGTGA